MLLPFLLNLSALCYLLVSCIVKCSNALSMNTTNTWSCIPVVLGSGKAITTFLRMTKPLIHTYIYVYMCVCVYKKLVICFEADLTR